MKDANFQGRKRKYLKEKLMSLKGYEQKYRTSAEAQMNLRKVTNVEICPFSLFLSIIHALYN
jgi:hypothetical protein